METLKIIIDSQAKGDGPEKTAKGLDKLKDSAKTLVGAFAALKTAQAAIDFAKFGANVQRQATSLDNLAKSAGTSGKAIVEAIQGASDYTIDRMTAMEAANKAMMLDVAKSPEQFEKLAKVATALGRAMGQDAAKSIEDFTVAAGRQSMQIADNLGLTVQAGLANERYAAKVGKAADALSTAEKKQAFLNEMLRQGEAKMAELGDTTLDTAGKFERASAKMADTKAAAAELWVTLLDGSGALDGVNEMLSDLQENMEAVAQGGEPVHKATYIPPGNAKAVRELKEEYEDLTRAKQEEARWSQYGAAWEKRLASETENTTNAISYMDLATLDTVKSQGDLMHTVLSTQSALDAEKLALGLNTDATYSQVLAAQALKAEEDLLTASTQAATLAQLDLAAQLKDASSAQIAQAAILGLKEQLDAGKITFDEYRAAVSETQLSFGLATPESVALAEGIQKLNEDLAAGKIDAEHYSEALAALKLKIEQIPDKTVNIDINVRRHGYGGSIGEAGMDSVEQAAANVNYNVGDTAGGAGNPADRLATGTTYARGGLALVGEEGPELVDLPRGSRVYNAFDTNGIIGDPNGNVAGGAFRSSRGQLRVPGMGRGSFGGMGGGSFSQVWHNSFYLMETDAELLAKKIAEAERLKGVRKVA